MPRTLLIALLLTVTLVSADEPAPLKYADYFDVPKGLVRTYAQGGGKVRVEVTDKQTKDGVTTITCAVQNGDETGVMHEKVTEDSFWRGHDDEGYTLFKGPLKLDAVHTPEEGVTIKLVSISTKRKVGDKEYDCIVLHAMPFNAKIYFAKGIGMVASVSIKDDIEIPIAILEKVE